MLALPISMIISLVLAGLLLRMAFGAHRSWPVMGLLFACMLQGVVVALAQFYGVTSALLIQPVTASIVPPMAWLAFQATMIRPLGLYRDAAHLAAPAFTAFCAVRAPQILDPLIPVVFASYAAAIVWALETARDCLPLPRLDAGEWPPRIWRGIAAVLALSAASDVMLAAALTAGENWLQSWIVSVCSLASLLLIGVLALSEKLGGETAAATAVTYSEDDIRRDADIMKTLDAALGEKALFLDPGLSLARLSRRISIPAKQLSAAVNRTTGENISRYINGLRIRHACERLRAGHNVTAAMHDSGFNTKSNFNREFQRVTGASPSAWLSGFNAAERETVDCAESGEIKQSLKILPFTKKPDSTVIARSESTRHPYDLSPLIRPKKDIA